MFILLRLWYLCSFCVGLDRRFCSFQYPNQTAKLHFHHEPRKLRVLTCETRPDSEDYSYWNLTSRHLRKKDRLSMVNLCSSGKWNGFSTKIQAYRQYLSLNLHNKSFTHVLITDSDVFWSARSLQHIWQNYDCARRGKELVFSSESSCWLDRPCHEEDFRPFYGYLFHNSSAPVPINAFINSGVIMGRKDLIWKMLEHLVNPYYPNIEKFNDQRAMTNYSVEILNSNEFAVDYHQFLSAACLFVFPNPHGSGFYSCMTMDQKTYVHRCVPYPVQSFIDQGFFLINEKTCLAERNLSSRVAHREELSELSLTPILWHGMGKTRKLPAYHLSV